MRMRMTQLKLAIYNGENSLQHVYNSTILNYNL